MVEPQALLSTLPGERLPADFQEVWRQAGFSCRPVDLAALNDVREMPTPLTILWVERSWNRGIERLADLPKAIRTLTVLVGDSPSKKIFGDIRDAGGLGGFTWPLPDWAPAALTDAVERSGQPAEGDLASALEGLEIDLVRLPEELLDRTTRAAQQLTGSDLVLMMLGSPRAKAYVLSSGAGGWHLEPGAVVAERLGLPLELLSSVPFSLKVRPGPTTALVVPLVARSTGIEGSFKRLDGAILLSWKTPHLPSASDLQRLKALAAVTRVALLRLSDLALSATRQHILSDALANLSRFPGSDVAGEYEQSLRGILFAFAGCPGLLALWARISESSREKGAWISFPLVPGLPLPQGSLAEEYSGPFDGLQGTWVFSRPFPGAPGFGQLIAVFDSQAAAQSGKTRMQQLADSLFLATRLIRRTKNSLETDRLSHLSEQESALAFTGEAVKTCLDADGAKIFVIERDPVGKKIRQIFSTLAGDQPKQTVRFKSDNRGFADWVLDNDDWLLIPERESPQETGKTPERCDTGRHGEQFLLARPETQFVPGLRPEDQDKEKTMLFFPLASRNQVAGVLAVWRDTRHPFHRDLDVESLTYLAPYVAATCQRALRTEKALQQEEETAHLAKECSASESLGDAYRAVARGVGKLAEAACAILLHHDPQDKASLRQSAIWIAEEVPPLAKEPRLPTVAVGDLSPEGWAKAIEEHCTARFKGFRFRSLLIPPRESPAFAVALLDPADDDAKRLFFADDLLEHFARSYLQFAAGLLETHVTAFASLLVDKIGATSIADPKLPQRILENAAETLKTATNADAVLVYTGTPRQMKVRFSRPESAHAIGLTIVPGSLTAESLRTLQPRRLLDVEETEQKVHDRRLRVIARSFGWKRVRSWLCCPIVHEQQCTGLLKFLTHEEGISFGKDHETIVKVVADRTALEMYKAGRRVVLEDLLQLSNDLAGLVGAELGQTMVDRLRQWVEDRLLRPHCEVAVVSRLESGGTLIKKVSPGTTDTVLDRLDSLSLEWNKEEKTWSAASPLLFQKPQEVLPAAGHAVPITLPGIKLLGHLILLDEEPFEKDELEAIRQAAGYVAVLLNGELERLREKQEMGRFRHAVIGPVQGVTSAALLLAALAEEAGVEKSRVERLRTRLKVEALVIRLWKENQRFYQKERVEIKARREFLKPVVDRCVERFRDMLTERGIGLKLAWPYQGGVQAFFDADAVDLVLSNLLDNARKYSFNGRIVSVGAQLHEKADEVAIWVEDVGHEVPSNAVGIYGLGQRFVKQDKWRTIGGEGLGLAMSAAIVHAHGGELSHNSEKIADGKGPDTTPYRVRFTFTLPLSWRPN